MSWSPSVKHIHILGLIPCLFAAWSGAALVGCGGADGKISSPSQPTSSSDAGTPRTAPRSGSQAGRSGAGGAAGKASTMAPKPPAAGGGAAGSTSEGGAAGSGAGDRDAGPDVSGASGAAGAAGAAGTATAPRAGTTGGTSAQPDPSAEIFDPAQLPRFDIELPAESAAALETVSGPDDPRQNEWVRASFR